MTRQEQLVFLPCGRHGWLPEETFVSRMTAEGTRVYHKAESACLTILKVRNLVKKKKIFFNFQEIFVPILSVKPGAMREPGWGTAPCILISVKGTGFACPIST